MADAPPRLTPADQAFVNMFGWLVTAQMPRREDRELRLDCLARLMSHVSTGHPKIAPLVLEAADVLAVRGDHVVLVNRLVQAGRVFNGFLEWRAAMAWDAWSNPRGGTR